MTTTEELSHKKVQAIYLRKLLENVNEEISALENADPYAELKAANAAGKRIAFFDDRYKEFSIVGDPTFCHAAKKYKIVEDDEEVIMHVLTGFGDVMTKYTRSALTGKIAAEVVG
jgi:hypothetical protein